MTCFSPQMQAFLKPNFTSVPGRNHSWSLIFKITWVNKFTTATLFLNLSRFALCFHLLH